MNYLMNYLEHSDYLSLDSYWVYSRTLCLARWYFAHLENDD